MPGNDRGNQDGNQEAPVAAVDSMSRQTLSSGRTGLWLIPSISAASPRVRDTRISVSLILESLAAGMTISESVDAYPSQTEESVRGVLAELAHAPARARN